MLTAFDLDQLCGDADGITGLLQAAFQHVIDVQLLRHFHYVDGLAFIDKGGIAGDHHHLRHLC